MLRSTVLLCCALTAVLGTTACSSSDSGTATAPSAASAAPSESAPSESAPSESAPSESAAGTSPSASPAPAEAAAPAQIVIESFDYEVPATVEAGALVEVTNEDAEAHTVTLGDSDISVLVAGGETVQMTAPAEPGEYGIRCEFHGGMEAMLVVV